MANTTDGNEGEIKSDLIQLLEFEMKQVRDENAKPGWTIWALLGAMAGFVWLILKELEIHADKVKLDSTLLIVVFLAFALEASKMFQLLISPKFFPNQTGIRFWHSNDFLPYSRLHILGDLAWYAFVLSLVVFFPFLGSKVVFWITAVNLSLNVLGGIATFISSYFAIPFSPFVGGRNTLKFGAGFYLIISSISLFAITSSLITKSAELTISEWRVAILGVAGIILFLRLLETHSQNPLLNTLVDLRRKLGLGQIDCRFAKKQTETALEGMDTAEVLRGRIESVLSKRRQIVVFQKVILDELKAFTSCFHQENAIPTNDHKIICDSVLNSVEQKMSDLQKLVDEEGVLVARLKKKTSSLRTWFPSANDDIGQSIKILMEKMDESKSEENTINTEFKKEFQRLKELFPEAKTDAKLLLTNSEK